MRGCTASRNAGLDEVFAAMVRNQQHVGFDRSGAGQQGLLLRGFDVPHQQCHGLRVRAAFRAGHAQHAACRVGGGPGGRARRPWGAAPQKPRHPTPSAALPRTGVAGRKACSACSASIDPVNAAPGRLGQHGGCTTGVVGIAVAEHEHVHPFAQRPQQGHQHAVARIAFAAEARACVVQQGGAWPCAPARHCPGQCQARAAQPGPAQA